MASYGWSLLPGVRDQAGQEDGPSFARRDDHGVPRRRDQVQVRREARRPAGPPRPVDLSAGGQALHAALPRLAPHEPGGGEGPRGHTLPGLRAAGQGVPPGRDSEPGHHRAPPAVGGRPEGEHGGHALRGGPRALLDAGLQRLRHPRPGPVREDARQAGRPRRDSPGRGLGQEDGGVRDACTGRRSSS